MEKHLRPRFQERADKQSKDLCQDKRLLKRENNNFDGDKKVRFNNSKTVSRVLMNAVYSRGN